MIQKFYVQGNVSFPLIFPTQARNKEEALSYVSSVINNQSVLKVEMDVHCVDNKIHLILCDEYNFTWR